MKHIVILGGGFAGVTCAKALVKKLKSTDVRITIIDKELLHWFHADFYEVATSPEEVTETQGLRDSVAVPIKTIFKSDSEVTCIKDTVVSIDPQKRTVQLALKGDIQYDYLVSALGSQACYYSIPGAKDFTLPLKSVTDALRIRNAIEFLVQRHRQDTTKRSLKIVVIGGGFSGVELAAELVGFVDLISWKHGYPREKIDVSIMEGATRVLSGLPEKVSKDTSTRLRDLGVILELNSHITEVADGFISLADGQRLSFDCAIWTAGVEGVEIPFTEFLQTDRCHRVLVNNAFQVEKFGNIFFIGDSAATAEKSDPPTASFAIAQAGFVARALIQVMHNQKPLPYKSHEAAYVIPLGGKFAIYVGKNFYTVGFFAYVIKLWRTFRYYTGLIGFSRAFSLMLKKQSLYEKNDA